MDNDHRKKSLLLLSLYSLLLLAINFSVQADVYKWVDESGRVHYGDKPSKREKANAEKIDAKISSYSSVTYSLGEGRAENNKPPKSNQRVIMYSTAWCGYCKKARKYFKAKGIRFVEYDIEKNARAKQDYDALGGRGVPVILVGKQRMNGFSETGFDRLYGS